uniref:Uncharacterized protein n=1 Tax=Micrurus spixii TaxID=129469 RepID=A0A2D4N1R9_9SAUR
MLACNAKSVLRGQSTPDFDDAQSHNFYWASFYFFAATTFPAFIIATGCKGCNQNVPTQNISEGIGSITSTGVGTFREKILCPSHSIALWGKDPLIPILWNRAVAISTLCTSLFSCARACDKFEFQYYATF